MDSIFCEELSQHLSQLQRFALRLAGSRTAADDLVQETMLRAMTHAEQFQRGTNLMAWLTTILRNTYFNERRRERRLQSFDVCERDAVHATNGDQEWRLYMGDVENRMARLPAVQRDALLLVGASGLSYDRAAQLSGCAVGTMKSRVSRGRLQLQSMLEASSDRKNGPSRHWRDLEHLAHAA